MGLAEAYGWGFFEVSAKTGWNVDAMIEYVV